MKVKILSNKGNLKYDKYIGQEFEAKLTQTGLYEIDAIKSGVINNKGRNVGTQWFPKEIKKMKYV